MLLSQLQESHRRHLRCERRSRRATTSWSPTATLPAAGGARRHRRRGAHRRRAAAAKLALSLYLDPALLARLARADPLERLHAGNVADCCTALEGVSHFLYLAWNAGHDKPVSLLELEMQAEVDKYVASHWLLRRQLPERFPAELPQLLFERARIDRGAGGRARRAVPGGEPLRGEILPAVSSARWRAARAVRARRCWRSCAASTA